METSEETKYISNLTEYTNALATLTYFVNTKFVSKIIELPNTETEEPFKFFYTILHKTNNALDTCSLLLANYASRPHHVDSLIIILRSIITDSVVFRYLILESQGDNELEKLKSNIKAIYFDHIQHTLKNVENCFPHIHGFTDEQVKQTIADVKAKKAEYYNEAGCRTIKKFPTSVLTILTSMAKKTNDKNEISNIRSFYHFYDIYSKYEHPGEFSFSLIHQQYREQTQQSFANDIVYVITVLIIPTMSSMLGLWQNIYRTQEKPYMDLVAKISNASTTFHRTFQKQK